MPPAKSREATDAEVSLAELKEEVRRFCTERDWDQFHRAKDVAIGLITEAAELLEHFRFLSPEEQEALFRDPRRRREIEDELADVLFFTLRFAERCGVDLATAFRRKMATNARNYPVAKSRGRNRKYTEL